jgi:hypothetical protein
MRTALAFFRNLVPVELAGGGYKGPIGCHGIMSCEGGHGDPGQEDPIGVPIAVGGHWDPAGGDCDPGTRHWVPGGYGVPGYGDPGYVDPRYGDRIGQCGVVSVEGGCEHPLVRPVVRLDCLSL